MATIAHPVTHRTFEQLANEEWWNDPRPLMPGDRVLAPMRWPPGAIAQPALIVCRYGIARASLSGKRYPDLVDIEFDHLPREVHHGYPTRYVKEWP